MRKLLTSMALIAMLSTVVFSKIANAVEIEKGYVSVNQSAIKEVVPNKAEITIGIETSDVSLNAAADANKKIANKVYSTLKSQLSSSDFIKTNSYSAKPIYTYTKENKGVFDKYVVTNSVIVKTQKIELVSKLIDSAVKNGATNVENLNFSSTNYDSICNEALSELSKKAYIQAETVAKAMNTLITGVKSINASCTPDNGVRPYYDTMMMKNAVGAVESTPIEIGKQKINITIDAAFYLK